jgi:glycosyltransferase involved in cell wall biosynthesis
MKNLKTAVKNILGQPFESRNLNPLGLNKAALKIYNEMFKLEKKGYHFYIADCDANEELWIDVTHTVIFPHMTGVQRVVRKLCYSLKDNKNVQFVKFNSSLRCYQIINSKDNSLLLNFGASVGSSKGQVSKIALKLRIKNFIRDFLGERLFLFLLGLYYSVNNFIFNKPPSGSKYDLIPLPAGQRVLIPEVFGVSNRTKFIREFHNAELLKFGAIFYDLIPIKRPDLAQFEDSFAEYLNIFHFVDRVSSISDYAKNDLLSYLKTVGIKTENMKIRTDLLGMDPISPMSTLDTNNLGKKIIFLAVGSIEKRKNQHSILEALKYLTDQKNKIQIKLIGHLNPDYDEFNQALDDAKAAGFDVEIQQRADDEDLNKAFADCTATLFCSLEEGFGLPVLESVCRKRVCITSKLGSMKEIGEISNGVLFIDPYSEKSIAEAMKLVIENSAEFQSAKSSIQEKIVWPTWEEYSNNILTFNTK